VTALRVGLARPEPGRRLTRRLLVLVPLATARPTVASTSKPLLLELRDTICRLDQSIRTVIGLFSAREVCHPTRIPTVSIDRHRGLWSFSSTLPVIARTSKNGPFCDRPRD